MKNQELVKDILKEHSNVYIRHLSLDEQFKCTLKSIEDNTLVIHSKKRLNDVSLCDPIICKVQNNSDVFIISGEVIQLISPDSVGIEIKTVEKSGNKRRHPRFEVSLNAVISKKETLYSEYATVSNISMSGICLNSNVGLIMDKVYIVNLFLSKNDLVSFEGKIVREKVEFGEINIHKYEYGIEITLIDGLNKKKFQDYIETL